LKAPYLRFCRSVGKYWWKAASQPLTWSEHVTP
jgi:hypothetical protein